MKWLLISSLCWVFMAPVKQGPGHALYISVISVEHEEDERGATVQFKIFKDDLNDAIYNECTRRHEIDQIDHADYQRDIKSYLNNHFKLYVNDGEAELHPDAFEIQGDAAFISCTASVPADWMKTKIEATILYELFPTQQNMIQYRDGKVKRFDRLSKRNCSVVYQ